MFAYCGNNPVRRSDPSGHRWVSDWEEKIRAEEEAARQAEEENKKEFLQKYNDTYGKSFDVGSANYFRVGKDKGGLSSFEAYVVNSIIAIGAAICTCGVGATYELTLFANISISSSSGLATGAVSSFIITPNEHDIYVVETGTVNWELNPVFGWIGEVRGQRDIYKINDDGTLTHKSTWFFRESAKDLGIAPPPISSDPGIDL